MLKCLFPSVHHLLVRDFLIDITIAPFPAVFGLKISTLKKGTMRKEVKETEFKFHPAT